VIDLGNVVLVETPRSFGFGLGMTLVRLPASKLLVHSPTWDGEGTFERVLSVGTPSVLMAPNYFHHLSLPRFRARWPEAVAVASDGSRPRLERQGHAGLAPLSAAALPDGARFLVCEGVKNGEAWISLPGDGGPTWIVCDAFFNVPSLTGVRGAMLRWIQTGPGLAIGQSWRWLAIADEARYRAWLLETIAAERPRRIVFSHGEPILDGAADRLCAIAERRLRTKA
jgi:hypothetical protein